MFAVTNMMELRLHSNAYITNNRGKVNHEAIEQLIGK